MATAATRPAMYHPNGQYADVIDRLPPHSIEAEEATIGSCLIDPAAIERVAAILRDEDAPFYIVKNQWVWDAGLALYQRGEPIDFVTITRELTARGQIDELGGPAYISHLINVVPTAMHAEGYARIVIDHATRRRLLDAASYLAQAAYDESELATITIDRAQRSLDTLKRSKAIGTHLTLHWAHEALEPQPPIDWIIGDDSRGLLTSGSVGLIAGDGGIGKTFAALDLCVAKAKGSAQWLGFALTPGPVLLVDEESGDRRLKRRLAEVMAGHNAPDHLPLAYITMAGLQLLDPAGPLMLDAAIEESGARLLVIDALIDVIGGSDENAATEMQPAFHALRVLAEKHQCAFLVLDHTNRAGSYRGTSHKKMAVDLLLIAERKKDSDTIEFTVEKARDIEPIKFAAVMNFAPGSFNLSPATPMEKQEHYSKGESYVIRFLQSRGGQAPLADIGARADSVSEKTALNLTRALVDKGITQRIDEGGKGDKAVYALTAKGRLINA